MRLPDRLDYEEINDAGDSLPGVTTSWWPEVRCTVFGCAWRYDADWSELGDGFAPDWDVLHPPHKASDNDVVDARRAGPHG